MRNILTIREEAGYQLSEATWQLAITTAILFSLWGQLLLASNETQAVITSERAQRASEVFSI